MLSLKWGGLFLVLALAGCKDAAGPAVPKEDFSFKVQNEIQQTGTSPDSAQLAVRFSVSVPGDVPTADLSKIQQVDILWPNKYVRTPILSGFQADGDSLTATRILVDRTDGLLQGVYTLEVFFIDGQQITDTRYCDGNLLAAPTIDELVIDSTSVYMAWQPPSQYHRWHLYLKRVQPAPEEVVTDGVAGAGSGSRFKASFDFAFQPGATYVLIMEMENDCNHRVISLPVS
jgi:hypothetical protein